MTYKFVERSDETEQRMGKFLKKKWKNRMLLGNQICLCSSGWNIADTPPTGLRQSLMLQLLSLQHQSSADSTDAAETPTYRMVTQLLLEPIIMSLCSHCYHKRNLRRINKEIPSLSFSSLWSVHSIGKIFLEICRNTGKLSRFFTCTLTYIGRKRNV